MSTPDTQLRQQGGLAVSRLALGLAQMRRIDALQAKREQVTAWYNERYGSCMWYASCRRQIAMR